MKHRTTFSATKGPDHKKLVHNTKKLSCVKEVGNRYSRERTLYTAPQSFNRQTGATEIQLTYKKPEIDEVLAI